VRGDERRRGHDHPTALLREKITSVVDSRLELGERFLRERIELAPRVGEPDRPGGAVE
jgi:hypothetical protein